MNRGLLENCNVARFFNIVNLIQITHFYHYWKCGCKYEKQRINVAPNLLHIVELVKESQSPGVNKTNHVGLNYWHMLKHLRTNPQQKEVT